MDLVAQTFETSKEFKKTLPMYKSSNSSRITVNEKHPSAANAVILKQQRENGKTMGRVQKMAQKSMSWNQEMMG